MAEFEAKYHDASHAERYRDKRRQTWSGRLRDRFEQRLVDRALRGVGRVRHLLDCPCGTGRFWSTLSRHCDALHAADQSARMIETGRADAGVTLASAEVARAESLPHADGSMDLVFSNRLLHHVVDDADRVAILCSFARVSRRWVVFSTWESGNRTERRHRKRDERRPRPANRIFVPIDRIRSEVERAGLRVVRELRKLRGVSPLVMLVCEKADAS